MNYYGATKVTAAYEKHLQSLFDLKPTALSADEQIVWQTDSDRFYNVILKTYDEQHFCGVNILIKNFQKSIDTAALFCYYV